MAIDNRINQTGDSESEKEVLIKETDGKLNDLEEKIKKGERVNIEFAAKELYGSYIEKGIDRKSEEFKELRDRVTGLIRLFQEAKKERDKMMDEHKEEGDQKFEVAVGGSKESEGSKPSAAEPEIKGEESEVSKELRGAGYRIEDFISIFKQKYSREDFEMSNFRHVLRAEEFKNREDATHYYNRICTLEENIKNLDIPKDSNELIVKRKELIDKINDFRKNYLGLGIEEIEFKEPRELVLEELKEERIMPSEVFKDMLNELVKNEAEFDDPKLKDFIEEQEKKYNSGGISLEQFKEELKTKSSFASREDTERIKDKIASVQAKYIMLLEPEKEAQGKTEKVNADLGEEKLQGDKNGLKGASNLEGDEIKKKGEKAVLEKAEGLKQALLNNEITQREFNKDIDGIIRRNNMSEGLKEKLSRVKKETMEEWKEKNPRKLVQNGKNVAQEPGKEPKIEEETPKTHLEEVEKEISDLINSCESKEECLEKLTGIEGRENVKLSVQGRENNKDQAAVVALVNQSIKDVKGGSSGKWSKEKVGKKEEGEMRLQRLINQDNAKKQAEQEEKTFEQKDDLRLGKIIKQDKENKAKEKEISKVEVRATEPELEKSAEKSEHKKRMEEYEKWNKDLSKADERTRIAREKAKGDKEIAGKAETLEQVKERKKAFEGAAQAVVEAEARLKKAEKNQRRYGAIISAFNFKKKADGEADNELLAAQKNLQEANRKYKDLTRQHMEDAFQDKNVEAAEQKFNAIKAKMDAGILLEDKRMEAQEKGGEGLVGKIQLALRKYHKLPFKTHLKIMGGIILVSGIAPLALSAALSGTVLTTVLVLNRILSTVGGMATAESMIDNRLKKHRTKKGQTLESQRSLAEGYVLEGTEGININTMEGKLAFLNKASGDADSEIARRMSEIKNIEHKQNIGKWLAVAGVGAFFALGGPEKIFRFGKEKLFGKAPEVPPIKKPIGSGAGKLEAPLADSNTPVSEIAKKMPSAPAAPEIADSGFMPSEAPKTGPGIYEKLDLSKLHKKGVELKFPGSPELKMPAGIAAQGEKIAEKTAEAISKISPEKLIETAKPGDSIWKMLENKSSELFGKEEWYKNMDKIQKIHFTDTLKRKMLEGRPSEFLKVGETVDLSKAFGGDGSIIKNLAKKYVEGGDIIKGGAKYENIEKVSGVIKNNINGWTRAKGSSLTTSEISQKVRDALGGIGGKISKKAGEKISGDIPAVPRWNGLGSRPEAITTMADSSAYGKIGNAAERIISENLKSLKNSLSKVSQNELKKIGHYSPETFLEKKAFPHMDMNDLESVKAFNNLQKAAREARLSGAMDDPKKYKTLAEWFAKNGEKVGVKLKGEKFFDEVSESIGRMGSF